MGHSGAVSLFTPDLDENNFEQFSSSPHIGNEYNFDLLKKAGVKGGILFSDNATFCQNFKNYLKDRIILQTEIVSNIYNNTPINILIVRTGENDYKPIYEISSKNYLRKV